MVIYIAKAIFYGSYGLCKCGSSLCIHHL